MKKYIELEAAIREFDSNGSHFVYGIPRCKGIISRLKMIPTSNVREVLTATWIGEGDGYADGEMVYDIWSCSCCGFTVDEGENSPPEWNYCPNCGAEFEKEKGE